MIRSIVAHPVWAEARRALAIELTRLLDVPRPVGLPADAALDNATTMLLAGWLPSPTGSDRTCHFECEIKDLHHLPLNMDPISDRARAETQARKASQNSAGLAGLKSHKHVDLTNCSHTLRAKTFTRAKDGD